MRERERERERASERAGERWREGGRERERERVRARASERERKSGLRAIAPISIPQAYKRETVSVNIYLPAYTCTHAHTHTHTYTDIPGSDPDGKASESRHLAPNSHLTPSYSHLTPSYPRGPSSVSRQVNIQAYAHNGCTQSWVCTCMYVHQNSLADAHVRAHSKP